MGGEVDSRGIIVSARFLATGREACLIRSTLIHPTLLTAKDTENTEVDDNSRPLPDFSVQVGGGSFFEGLTCSSSVHGNLPSQI